MRHLLNLAFDAHCKFRRDFQPDDPPYVGEAMKASPEFRASLNELEAALGELLEEMRASVPLASYRNQSHMYWDITMPSAVGYFAAMLYNQNNVAAEASPVTTFLEMQVGEDLCRMLGFTIPTAGDTCMPSPWGHITCDGSVANAESMWAARNLKYYAVSLVQALRHEDALADARGLTVTVCDGRVCRLMDLGPWEQLNLRLDDVLALPARILALDIAPAVLDDALSDYLLQNIGLAAFSTRFLPDVGAPVILAPCTAHYSWPKAAALLGLGRNVIQSVRVDLDCRMEVAHLRELLEECIARKRPVLQVVAVIGTTEESAVDPLAKIVKLREEVRARGLDFTLHLDAAWGGYFAAMVRGETPAADGSPGGTPVESMSAYVRAQYAAFAQADTITVDPHKGGFCPYPAGALCYRNGALRNLVSFEAPVVYHGGLDPTVGVYGIEGSKPGAAAAGVYLSHRLIRPDRSGYGRLLGQCVWNSKRLYASLLSLAGDEDPFFIVPLQRLPAQREGEAECWPPEKIAGAVAREMALVRDYIVPKSNEELLEDKTALALFTELGSDLNIVAYAFNFRWPDGTPNDDAGLANALNDAIYRKLSIGFDKPGEVIHPGVVKVPTNPMIITDSALSLDPYGLEFLLHFGGRLRLSADSVKKVAVDGLTFLISTTQDPWVTYTAISLQAPDGNLLPTIMEGLRQAVLECVDEVRKQAPSGSHNNETRS
jgi:glutamate/tyrosine decarboxylase-like PLP-dependent enzyme